MIDDTSRVVPGEASRRRVASAIFIRATCSNTAELQVVIHTRYVPGIILRHVSEDEHH